MGPNTGQAVWEFERANGQQIDGDPGPITRRRLIEQYMDLLCIERDSAGKSVLDVTGKVSSFTLDKADFLGIGADAGGKADYQGCSDFNPVLVFSADENADF